MGFKELIVKLESLFSSQAPGSLEKKSVHDFAEGRIHERYPVSYSDAITITTEKSEVYNVLNISFGGFASPLPHGNESFYSRGQRAHIEFLGDSCPALIHKVYQGPEYVGFRFEHRDEKTLVFLREIIEYLRLGATLHILRKEFLIKEFQSDSWVCLRGEGPSELSFHLDQSETTDEARFSFKSGEESYKIIFKNGVFKTQTSERPTAPQPNRHLIKIFLCVLAGLKNNVISDQLHSIYEAGKGFIANKSAS